MPRYQKIYEEQAPLYEELVSKEDFQCNILQTLSRIRPFSGLQVIEFGAGTGRLTALIAPYAKEVLAFDAFPMMLEFAERKFRRAGIKNVSFAQAENKKLPVETGAFDLSIAGWTFGHCTSWHGENWKTEISSAVSEMLRVLRDDGTAIILETLGTGQVDPVPPSQKLADYYDFLEKDFGFSRVCIRTDYRFESLASAQRLTSTFFGRNYDFQVDSSGAVFLPECTGIWHRRAAI